MTGEIQDYIMKILHDCQYQLRKKCIQPSVNRVAQYNVNSLETIMCVSLPFFSTKHQEKTSL